MKKRIHLQIALVGGQPTPVYQGIMHMQPNQIMLVCSQSSRKIANDIRQQLPSYSDKDIFIFEMSDTDLCQMYETAERIADSIPKGIILSLNITGGMKLWSVIFNNIFRRKRRSCHTFFIGQNGTFFDLKEKVTKGSVNFDMDTQFKILGHSLDEYTPLSEYTKEDNDVLNRVRNWGLSYRFHTPLYKITNLFVEKYKAKYHDPLFLHSYCVDDGDNFLSWDSSERVFVCNLFGSEQVFSSPHVEKILLNTGWFELYTARMLSKIHPEEDIRINCVFKNTKRLPKNEIDIILNTGTKLIFIECKTQVFNTTDIDKFNSAVKNYGGLGSKALFVTNSRMKPEAQEKCDDHNITTFYFDNDEYHTTQHLLDAFSAVIKKLNDTWNIK